jgi:hypothetical protein
MAKSSDIVTDCHLDPERRKVFQGCMESYGLGDADPEWPWNVISRKAVFYSCGRIAREGAPVEHRHDPNEISLCRNLAGAATRTMQGCDIGMGSESSNPFRPFFVVANLQATVPATVSETIIRESFGGTIYPGAQITIEPLAEGGNWWDRVRRDCVDNEDCADEFFRAEGEKQLARWSQMVQWFQSCKKLQRCAFVMIGQDEPRQQKRGSEFPRIALGITDAGSLVGIGGWVVYT